MKAIKVNADYEIALFENKVAPKIINHSLEFLAFFLEDRPVVSQKKYDQKYLSYVRSVTGREPVCVDTNDFENWWGSLKDPETEREINSKIYSANLSRDSQVIRSLEELKLEDKTYLAKNPFGMSGQNFITFRRGEESKLSSMLQKTGALIVEPLFNRVHDFSHYILPDGSLISYQNVVDTNFQYKGTVFRNINEPILENLSFYKEIEKNEWDKFSSELSKIVSELKQKNVRGDYSVDSFTYIEDGKLKIRTMSEINYRKTMGLIAWMLAGKYGKKWNAFLLGKAKPFSFIQDQIRDLEGCLHLSPGDTRFDMFLLSADSEDEGRELIETLKNLLPDSQLAI